MLVIGGPRAKSEAAHRTLRVVCVQVTQSQEREFSKVYNALSHLHNIFDQFLQPVDIAL